MKCGETDLAVDIYGQMGREGMPRDRSIFVALIEMFVKLGRVPDALSALADLHALGEPPDTHLYNLVLVAATKMGPPRFALTVYHRCVTSLSCSSLLLLAWARYGSHLGGCMCHLESGLTTLGGLDSQPAM